MPATDHFDVIIIGSGAGGGTLAYRLAPSGKRILILERGGFVPREADNWSSRAAVREEKYHAPETWFDGHGKEFQPGTHYNVGGNTKFYGAALFRMREADFGEIQHYGGVSPAWPVTYEDMEPYYTQAEYLYEVRGERQADPTEPWSSLPYAHPAVSHEPRIQELHDHFTRVGLHPFHVPLGIRLSESTPQTSPCIRCKTCDGYACLVGAKSDAQTMCLQPALHHENVTLLTNARALRLDTSPSGRSVTRVVVERHGRTEAYSAEIVVSSCGAVNSAGLLLKSANDQHPNGLANGSGMVGRHYMAHNNSVLFYFCAKPNPTLFQKTLAVNDYYHSGSDSELPLGHISMVGKFDGQMFKAGAPPLAPVSLLEAMGRRSIDFWITSEDLPDPENRVAISADGRIELKYKENNLDAHRGLIAALKKSMRSFDDGRFLTKGGKIPLAGVAHQCGTLRFGTDPRSSVLDVNCKAHELDNLYVVDASFFCSSSAVNPALTIIANALRVGDHLLDQLGASKDNRHVYTPARRLPILA